jgi:hypothetical protein
LSLYGKILDVLTSYLLALQHRDAWLKEESWKIFPDRLVKEGQFRGRWCVDHAGLIRRGGAVYISDDRTTRMEVLRANHDDPWQGGHFGIRRTEKVILRSY